MSLRTRTNAAFAAALRQAAEAVIELDRAGNNVHALVIRDLRPVLLIESPARPLAGSVSMRSTENGRTDAIWYALVAGCRVEWKAPPHLVPLAG